MSRWQSLAGPLLVVATVATVPDQAWAQARPRPEWLKGHKLKIKLDSSPQQAAIYINSKDYGIQGYTPSEVKLPKGTYKIILELPGWKSEEREMLFTRSGAFTFTLVRQARPAVLDLRPGPDQSATGATISVDGAQVGTVPNRIEVAQGSHLLEIKRPGYNDYRDTVAVNEGEQRTIVVNLVAQPKPGSLLVTADVDGAEVWVDGQRRDTAPALVGDLTEGDHTVEVRKEGLPSWKQLVRVLPGQQTKVVAAVKPQVQAPVVGSLKVLSATPMADVILDGEPKGPTNIEIKDVRPGVHLVEVRAPGFLPKRMETEIKAGDTRVLGIDLLPAEDKKAASVNIISPVPDAEVFIDGASVGRAPVTKGDLAPGKHFVTVRKSGFAEYHVELELQAGKTFLVSANLKAVGGLKVLSNPAGAEVLVDGAPMGKTPLSLPEVAVGDHVVEYKLLDHFDAKAQIRIAGGEQAVVQQDLKAVPKGPTPEQVERKLREQSSHGAMTLDQQRVNVDVGVGALAYFVMARLTTGIFRFGHLGMDIAAELRTSFIQTDVGLRPRLQVFRLDPIVIGADLGFYGGGGPHKRDEFTFEAGAMLSLIAGSRVTLTFRPYLQFVTERLCPSVNDIKKHAEETAKGIIADDDLYKSERDVCKTLDGTRGMGVDLPPTDPMKVAEFKDSMGKPTFVIDPRGRFDNTRFFLQVLLDVAATKNVTFWALVEAVPYDNQRQGFTNKFNILYATRDFPLYARVGASFKF